MHPLSVTLTQTGLVYSPGFQVTAVQRWLETVKPHTGNIHETRSVRGDPSRATGGIPTPTTVHNYITIVTALKAIHIRWIAYTTTAGYVTYLCLLTRPAVRYLGLPWPLSAVACWLVGVNEWVNDSSNPRDTVVAGLFLYLDTYGDFRFSRNFPLPFPACCFH